MRKAIYATLCCMVLTLLFGCGKQHKAESIVNDFIESNAVSDSYSVTFSPIDSTDRIPVGRIAAMKKSAKSDPLFKKNIVYGMVPTAGKYAFTRAKFINGNDTIVRTFYLDMALTSVIAFKEN